MKTNLLRLIIIISITPLLVNCYKTESHKPLVVSSGVPAKVTDIKVENVPGAAKISYTVPSDPDLLYVLATYKLANGEVKEVKSSVFKNHVLLEGFAQETDYVVHLSTVTRGEIKSEPVAVTIHPLKAPVYLVLDSMKANETFGGVNLQYTNPFNTEFVLTTLVKNESGIWVEKDRYYTSRLQENYSIRRPEFGPVPTEFAFFFTDKWKNKSDTLYKTITPLFEEEFDKSLWSDAALSDDSNLPRYSPLYQLWTPGETTYFFVSPNIPGLILPAWFTIDFGKRYRFGRMKVDNVRHHVNWMYAQGTPEIFEIWGSNEKTTDWSKWTLLGSFRCEKPSGLPVGTLSAEDQAQIKLGDTYDFEPSVNSYRYMRFKTVKTFGNTPAFYLLELTFFGAGDK